MAQTLTDRDARFLASPRIAALITTTADHHPLGVPVWFHWSGEAVEMFTSRHSPKVVRLRREPTVSVLVSNQVGEPEHWIAFDGPVRILDNGGFELAERLAERYWPLDDPQRAAELAGWREHRDVFCRLSLTPARIRTGG